MNKCKYYKIEKYLSTDGGVTWISTGISERGALISDDSLDCSDKLYATYSDSTTYSVTCNSSSTLSYTESKAHTTPYSSMTSAVIGECVTTIDGGAFQGCTSLSSVTIPESVTTIGYAVFQNCTSLSSVTIPDSVTTIGNITFQGCSGLTSIDIPSGVTSIGYVAFQDCTNLQSITCFAPTPPTLGGTAFDNTNNCPIYVLSGSVDTYKTAWSDYASRIQCYDCPAPTFDGKFYATYSDATTYSAECDSSSALTSATTRAHTTSYTAMTSAEIGDCVTSIDSYAFRYCSGLTSCTIGSGVTTIGDLTFQACSGLISIDIPNGVTSIGSQAFLGCSSLTSVTLGSGVTSIGIFAFRNCPLTSVTCLATTPPSMRSNAFYGANCPIYVPSESVNAYKSASGWSTYASMIQAIP